MKVSRSIARIAAKAPRRPSDIRGIRVVALSMFNGNVVAVRANSRGSGECSQYSHHAEERAAKAMRGYGWWDIVVLRFRKDGSLGMAKPCLGCDKILKKAGVDKVQYSTGQGDELCSYLFSQP